MLVACVDEAAQHKNKEASGTAMDLMIGLRSIDLSLRDRVAILRTSRDSHTYQKHISLHSTDKSPKPMLFDESAWPTSPIVAVIIWAVCSM